MTDEAALVGAAEALLVARPPLSHVLDHLVVYRRPRLNRLEFQLLCVEIMI